MESLPVTTYEVLALHFPKNGESTKMIIKFLDNEGKLQTAKIKDIHIKIEPRTDIKKYISVQILEKNLPSSHKSVWYNPVLLVPENFDFSLVYQ